MRSVPQSDISQSPFLWSRGTAARETLRCLDRKEFDAEPLLLKAELSRDQLSPESGGISVASQHRFLELAAIETNDSLLGLHVAAEMDLRDAGILFYLAAASTTVAEALEHLARYAGTANEAVHLEISQHQAETVLTVRPVGWYDEPWRQFSEFIALAVIRALNRATNRDFAPSHMTFAHLRELWVDGDSPHPAMPGRVHTDHRQLGVPSTRHGPADKFRGQPPAADPGGAC